jgi:hypothetical protein
MGQYIHSLLHLLGIVLKYLSTSWIKAGRKETCVSPPASGEVQNMWVYTFTPPYIFMEYCLIS